MTEQPRFEIPNAVLYRVTRLPLGIMAATCLVVTGSIVTWQQHRESERLQADVGAFIADQEHAFANELFLHEERALKARLQATVDQIRVRYPGVDVCLSLRAANQEGFLPEPILECRGEASKLLLDSKPKALRSVPIHVGDGISADVAFAAKYTRTIKDVFPPNFLIALITAFACAMAVDGILVRRLQARVVRPLLFRIEAHAKLAGIGHTTAGIAHDIKEPLHAIKKIAAHPINMERQALIKEAVAEIESLLEQMLAFSRPAPVIKNETDQIELVAETARIVDSFRKGLQLRGLDDTVALEMETDAGANDLKAAIGARELRRTVLNILHNALEALTSSGAADSRIRVSVARDDRMFRVDLANNGPPIAERDFEAIFLPFFSRRQASGGTGLGLAIARKCVGDAGGTVTATNRDGWVVFTLNIPMFQGGML